MEGGCYFRYGEKETDHLKSRDKRMAAVIDRIGPVRRACLDDLFEAVVNSIIGQQISTKAHQSIWGRIKDDQGRLDAQGVLAMGREKLQSYGTTWRKVDYIMDFARRVDSGEFDLAAVERMDDQEAIAALSSLKGVGVWTAEMILLFCLQRPDIFSYGDLAILRGLRMVYRHKELPPERFERYRRRFSPYCSVASLYLWAVAGGAMPELSDPAAAVLGRGKNAATAAAKKAAAVPDRGKNAAAATAKKAVAVPDRGKNAAATVKKAAAFSHREEEE